MQFSILGIRVRLSFFFPAIIALFLIFDTIGMLPCIIWGILIHELGHIFAFIFTGKDIEEIYFSPVGISIKTKGINIGFIKNLLIHCAGPLANLLCYILIKNNDNLEYLSAANIVLCLFNLLPAGNLDGGNILRLILLKLFSPIMAEIIFERISRLLIVVLFVLGIYILWYTKGNFTLIIMSVALFGAMDRGDVGY